MRRARVTKHEFVQSNECEPQVEVGARRMTRPRRVLTVVVEWLREHVEERCAAFAADAIERGEHVPEAQR